MLNIMTYKGIAKRKIIELEDLLPYPEGQPVRIWVEPFAEPLKPGSPEAIRQVMHEPPYLKWEDVDELERAIEESKLPVRQESVFDEVR
jgi:hypothetical protein